MLRRNYDFCIGAACYPEKHPEAATPADDLINLKRKVDAGADFLVSQLFFDNEHFFAFERRIRKVGIELPLLPGLMPITNFAADSSASSQCAARAFRRSCASRWRRVRATSRRSKISA